MPENRARMKPGRLGAPFYVKQGWTDKIRKGLDSDTALTDEQKNHYKEKLESQLYMYFEEQKYGEHV